jgi:hypothetical protein
MTIRTFIVSCLLCSLSVGLAAQDNHKSLRRSLQVSYGTLQALDVHSTVTAIRDGRGTEANPLIAPYVGKLPAFLAVKAAGAVATMWATEKISKKKPVGALLLMAAVNTAYAVIVAHNYTIGR